MPQPYAVDLERLLRFFQNVYAHALACQDVLEMDNPGPDAYVEMKEKWDRFAEQKFAMLFRAVQDPEGFARAVKALVEETRITDQKPN